MSVNYVQFVRGTPTAWSNLKNKKDDTLYFISEKNSDSGELYLGSKLIAGAGTDNLKQLIDRISAVESKEISLNDLKDVSIGIESSDGSVLTYDVKTHKWKNTVLSLPTMMIGATISSDGKSGLVPVPRSNAYNLYLRGDGQWSDPCDALKVSLSYLIGDDPKMSARYIAKQEVMKVLGSESIPDEYNTIEKIANWIVNNSGSGIPDGANRIATIENEIYDPSTGLKTRVQNMSDWLYDTVDENTGGINYGLVRRVYNVEKGTSDLQTKIGIIDSNVTTLKERLKWNKI